MHVTTLEQLYVMLALPDDLCSKYRFENYTKGQVNLQRETRSSDGSRKCETTASYFARCEEPPVHCHIL